MDIISQKQCSKCNEWFPATKSHFYADKKSPDGLAYICKPCNSAKGKSYRKNYAEKIKETKRVRNELAQKEREQREIHGTQDKKQCIKCLQWFPATASYFHRDVSTSYGLKNVCKSCRGYEKTFGKVPNQCAEGEKQCTKCLQIFPATKDYFYQNIKGKYGLTSTCKKCRGKVEWGRRTVSIKKTSVKKNICKENEKQCTKCLAIYPKTSEYFYRDRKSYTAECKQCRHKRYQAHSKEMIEQTLARRRANPEKYRLQNTIYSRFYRHNRIARKKSILGTHTTAQITELLKRQHYRCYYAACGHAKFNKVNGKYIYHVEHTFPISRVAGTDIPANDISYIVLACPHCNTSKGNKFPWEWVEGGHLL